MKPVKTWEIHMDKMVCEQFAVSYIALKNQIREAWRNHHDPWWREWIRERIVMLRRNMAVREEFVKGRIRFD